MKSLARCGCKLRRACGQRDECPRAIWTTAGAWCCPCPTCRPGSGAVSTAAPGGLAQKAGRAGRRFKSGLIRPAADEKQQPVLHQAAGPGPSAPRHPLLAGRRPTGQPRKAPQPRASGPGLRGAKVGTTVPARPAAAAGRLTALAAPRAWRGAAADNAARQPAPRLRPWRAVGWSAARAHPAVVWREECGPACPRTAAAATA